jgi:hypothetical protein
VSLTLLVSSRTSHVFRTAIPNFMTIFSLTLSSETTCHIRFIQEVALFNSISNHTHTHTHTHTQNQYLPRCWTHLHFRVNNFSGISCYRLAMGHAASAGSWDESVTCHQASKRIVHRRCQDKWEGGILALFYAFLEGMDRTGPDGLVVGTQDSKPVTLSAALNCLPASQYGLAPYKCVCSNRG